MLLNPGISLLDSWVKARKFVWRALLLISAVVAIALAGLLWMRADTIRINDALAQNAFVGMLLLLLAATTAHQRLEQVEREEKIDMVEQQFREHPEKPQAVWDLARVKLENYLDRNLRQVGLIFWLTFLVMVFGLGVVSWGLYEALQNPAKLPVSIVAAASGVLISFIGGSFLLIYRSILVQSKEYVTVLERINAVGMAVQVIETIPEESVQLKSQTKAELAKQLLTLYASSAPRSAGDGVPKA